MGGAYKGSWAVAITALSLLSVCLVLVIVKQDTFQERVQFSGHMTASQGAHSQHRLAVQAVGAEPGSAPKAKPRRESKTKAQMVCALPPQSNAVFSSPRLFNSHVPNSVDMSSLPRWHASFHLHVFPWQNANGKALL